MLYSIDSALTRWLNAPADSLPALDSAAVLISSYGVPFMVAAVALQWFLTSDKPRRRHAILAAGLSFILGLVLNQIILLLVHRIRPYDAGVTHLIIAKSADWSFPSDHATASVAIAATFAMLRMGKQSLWFGFAALLVCWSRLYVGIHYVGDVIGGAATALIAATLVVKIFKPDSRLNLMLVRIL